MPPRKSSSRAAAASPRTPSQNARLSAAKAVVREASGERAEAFHSLNPFVNEVVPPVALKALANYEYKASDNSILQRVLMLQHYWEFVVTFVPHWVAPNMLTFLAMCCSMSYPLLIISYEYRAIEIPNWVWCFSAVMLMAYHTLDAIDGKHARRSKCGSPLGEMFDHGCDALFAPFMVYASMRGMGASGSQFFTMTLCSHFGLFVTIFEQFLTGSFELGYINGPNEGNYFGVAFLWATWWLGGPSYWTTPMERGPVNWNMPPTLVQACRGYLPASFQLAVTRGDFMFCIFYGLVAVELIKLVRRCYLNLGHKQASVECFAAHVASFFIWALYATLYPQSAFSHAGQLSILFGMYYSYAASSTTVRRLCGLEAETNYKILIFNLALPLAKLFLRDRFCLSGYINFFVIASFLWYAFFLVSIFNQFARALDVNVLTLTDTQLKTSEAEENKRVKSSGKRHYFF